jgi:cell division cycle 14
MEHYKWPASEIIAWFRICRPGSVIGPQQIFVMEMQSRLFAAGEEYHNYHGSNKKRNLYLNKININNSNIPNSNNKFSETKLYKQIYNEQTTVSNSGTTQGDLIKHIKGINQKNDDRGRVEDKSGDGKRCGSKKRDGVNPAILKKSNLQLHQATFQMIKTA